MSSKIQFQMGGDEGTIEYGSDGDWTPPGMTVVHSNESNEKTILHNLTPGKIEIEDEFLTDEEKKEIILEMAVDDLDLDKHGADEDRFINLIINEDEEGIKVCMTETKVDYMIAEDGSWNPNVVDFPDDLSENEEKTREYERTNIHQMQVDEVQDDLKWDHKINRDPHNEFEKIDYGAGKDTIDLLEEQEKNNTEQNVSY